MERNPYFWQVDPSGAQLPYVDQLTMNISQDVESLMLDTISGRIDIQDVDAVETRFVRLSAPWGAGAALLAGTGLAALSGWAPALAILLSCWPIRALLRQLRASGSLAAEAGQRAEELQRMHRNFYGFDPSYHVARHHFVYRKPHAWTPRHLAVHR